MGVARKGDLNNSSPLCNGSPWNGASDFTGSGAQLQNTKKLKRWQRHLLLQPAYTLRPLFGGKMSYLSAGGRLSFGALLVGCFPQRGSLDSTWFSF